MIVKNEAHCIERCLDSVKPLIDFVCINDNGSTDGTQDKLIEWAEKNNVPVVILNNPWVSFDVNRSLVLHSIYEGWKDVDYVLMIDADEVIVFEAGFNPQAFKESLVHDIYDITTKLGGTVYHRPQLTSNKKKFSYRGVVHEFLQPLEPTEGRATAQGFFNMPIQDSARNKDPEKFKKDAEALKRAYDEETDPFLKSRYCFYLAQCYKDSGETYSAIYTYLDRAKLEFWSEERYISLLQAARLMRGARNDKEKVFEDEDILGCLIKAIDYSPLRAEALYEAMITCRDMGKMHAAYVFGKNAFDKCYYSTNKLNDIWHGVAQKDKPGGTLFLESWIYDWSLAYELSIIAYYANDKRLAKMLTLYTIDNNACPQHLRAQSKENLKFY